MGAGVGARALGGFCGSGPLTGCVLPPLAWVSPQLSMWGQNLLRAGQGRCPAPCPSTAICLPLLMGILGSGPLLLELVREFSQSVSTVVLSVPSLTCSRPTTYRNVHPWGISRREKAGDQRPLPVSPPQLIRDQRLSQGKPGEETPQNTAL